MPPLDTPRRRPPKHMDGLRVRYSSATAIVVETGSARDSADARDLTLGTEATVSITTIDAINGLDEKTCAATATTHGTATFEPSASLYSETPLSSTVRALTGTITSSTTAVTGTGTKFLSEVAVGDVIRSATKGASRVTAIASDTALTLAAAFPGGDVASGEAATLYENLIVRIAAETPRRVNTISHDGLSVVAASSWTSNTSGAAIKLGGEAVSCWYFPHVVYGTSGTGAILSTQRTRPYGVTGYTTAWRLIMKVRNGSGGDLTTFRVCGTGQRRAVIQAATANTPSAFTSKTWTTQTLPDQDVPPGTREVLYAVENIVSGTSASFFQVRENSTGPSQSIQRADVLGMALLDTLPVTGARQFDCVWSADTVGSAYGNTRGWWLDL